MTSNSDDDILEWILQISEVFVEAHALVKSGRLDLPWFNLLFWNEGYLGSEEDEAPVITRANPSREDWKAFNELLILLISPIYHRQGVGNDPEGDIAGLQKLIQDGREAMATATIDLFMADVAALEVSDRLPAYLRHWLEGSVTPDDYHAFLAHMAEVDSEWTESPADTLRLATSFLDYLDGILNIVRRYRPDGAPQGDLPEERRLNALLGKYSALWMMFERIVSRARAEARLPQTAA
jgi:hypothetical protein